LSSTTLCKLLIQEVDPTILLAMVSWGTNGSPYVYQHRYFSINLFCRICIVTTSELIIFYILTPLAWTSNTASTNISRIRYCIINKTLNFITIIHLLQLLWWILIHLWTLIHYLYQTYLNNDDNMYLSTTLTK
jgi:hypothetical protein